MRVKIWISGDEGPSHDFELLDAPRVGDRISISMEERVEEGIVATVSWHLQAIEPSAGSLGLEGESVGSVTVVHVVCHPTAELVQLNYERAEVDPLEATSH